jgi:tetratricopeptide (TPR) repeat protein
MLYTLKGKIKELLGTAIEKHGKFRSVAVATAALCALASSPFLISSAIENGRVQAEFDKYIALAETHIESESLDEAKLALEAADSVKPEESLVAKYQGEIQSIENDILNSKKIFAKAENAYIEGKRLIALELYLQVNPHKYKIDEVAKKKAAKLQKILVTEQLELAYQQARYENYAKAAKIVRQAIKTLPSDSRLNDSLEKYKSQYADQQSSRADVYACQALKVLDRNFTGFSLAPYVEVQEKRSKAPVSGDTSVRDAIDEYVLALEKYLMKLPYPDDGTVEMFTSISKMLISCKNVGVLINGS